MKKIYILLVLILFVFAGSVQAQTTVISANFDDITLLPGLGWVETNMSSPVGTVGYFQGNETVFPAYQGASTAYLGVNFNSVAGASTISNWMITPQITLQNGDEVSFWTRTTTGSNWPDRLQLWLNPLGTTNVGADANSTGDFTVLLNEVNPSLTVGGYPDVWTEFTATISGLATPTTCRIAFRYFVTNGGPSGSNSNYSGIDEFLVESSGTVTPVHDIGVIALVAPLSGELTNAETVTVTIQNFGNEAESNFDVALQIDGGTVETQTVSATVNPGATHDYTFTGTFDFSAAGVINVVSWTELAGDDDNSNDTLATSVNNSTNIGEIEADKFEIYPNPASDYVYIKTGVEMNGMYTVQIINETGQIVKSTEMQFVPQSEYAVSLGLPAGIYNIRIFSELLKVSETLNLIVK